MRRCPKCKHRLQHICSVNGPVTFFKGWKSKSKSEAKLNPRLFDVTEPLPRKAMPKPKIKTVEKVDLYYCKYCKVF